MDNKRNFKLVIEFDGTDFKGSQVQRDERTVQGDIEEAIFKVTNEKVRITACSRTDAGVHGRNFVLNFKSYTLIPAEKLMYPLNNALKNDIRVKSSIEVPMDFNSRKHAIKKTYTYRFTVGTMELPLEMRYKYFEKGTPDINKMKEAAKLFLGTNDFKAFRSTGSNIENTIRTIFELNIVKEKNDFILTITGDGFLYNMVRIITGTLIDVGNDVKTLKDIKEALITGDRKKSGRVVPAKGLTLEKVEY